MLYLPCTMISSVDLAYYGVSRAKDWVSVDCGTRSKIVSMTYYVSKCVGKKKLISEGMSVSSGQSSLLAKISLGPSITFANEEEKCPDHDWYRSGARFTKHLKRKIFLSATQFYILYGI